MIVPLLLGVAYRDGLVVAIAFGKWKRQVVEYDFNATLVDEAATAQPAHVLAAMTFP